MNINNFLLILMLFSTSIWSMDQFANFYVNNLTQYSYVLREEISNLDKLDNSKNKDYIPLDYNEMKNLTSWLELDLSYDRSNLELLEKLLRIFYERMVLIGDKGSPEKVRKKIFGLILYHIVNMKYVGNQLYIEVVKINYLRDFLEYEKNKKFNDMLKAIDYRYRLDYKDGSLYVVYDPSLNINFQSVDNNSFTSCHNYMPYSQSNNLEMVIGSEKLSAINNKQREIILNKMRQKNTSGKVITLLNEELDYIKSWVRQEFSKGDLDRLEKLKYLKEFLKLFCKRTVLFNGRTQLMESIFTDILNNIVRVEYDGSLLSIEIEEEEGPKVLNKLKNKGIDKIFEALNFELQPSIDKKLLIVYNPSLNINFQTVDNNSFPIYYNGMYYNQQEINYLPSNIKLNCNYNNAYYNDLTMPSLYNYPASDYQPCQIFNTETVQPMDNNQSLLTDVEYTQLAGNIDNNYLYYDYGVQNNYDQSNDFFNQFSVPILNDNQNNLYSTAAEEISEKSINKKRPHEGGDIDNHPFKKQKNAF